MTAKCCRNIISKTTESYNGHRQAMNEELDELERLAKIGRATEKAFEEGYSLMKLLYTVKLDMRYEDEYEEDVYEEIENLLEWTEREE